MLMMLLQTNPTLLEQLGRGATLIKKELERREQVEKMNVRSVEGVHGQRPQVTLDVMSNSRFVSHSSKCKVPVIWKENLVQGSYRSWKSWKVLEFYFGIFQDWEI